MARDTEVEVEVGKRCAVLDHSHPPPPPPPLARAFEQRSVSQFCTRRETGGNGVAVTDREMVLLDNRNEPVQSFEPEPGRPPNTQNNDGGQQKRSRVVGTRQARLRASKPF